jgi:hypothetical protein
VSGGSDNRRRFPLLGVSLWTLGDAWQASEGDEAGRRELAASPQRFIIDDRRLSKLVEEGPASSRMAAWQAGQAAQRSGRFPWTEPVVFQAGHFVVFRASGPVGELSCEAEDWFKILE